MHIPLVSPCPTAQGLKRYLTGIYSLKDLETLRSVDETTRSIERLIIGKGSYSTLATALVGVKQSAAFNSLCEEGLSPVILIMWAHERYHADLEQAGRHGRQGTLANVERLEPIWSSLKGHLRDNPNDPDARYLPHMELFRMLVGALIIDASAYRCFSGVLETDEDGAMIGADFIVDAVCDALAARFIPERALVTDEEVESLRLQRILTLLVLHEFPKIFDMDNTDLWGSCVLVNDKLPAYVQLASFLSYTIRYIC